MYNARNVKPKLLGKGSYGCVYEPNIPCDVETGKGVGKVMNIKNAHEEFEITNDIAEDLRDTVDKEDIDEYINPIVGECAVRLSDDQLRECDALKKEENQYQLIYKHAGIDMHKIIHNRSYSLNENLSILKMLQKMVCKMNTTFCKQRKSHMDIKPANILLVSSGKGRDSIAKGKLLPIDFGLVCDFENIYEINNVNLLNYEYPYFPFEFKLYVKTLEIVTEILYSKKQKSEKDPLSILDEELKSFFVREPGFSKFLNVDHKLIDRVILEASLNHRRYLKTFEAMIMNRVNGDVTNTINKFIETLRDKNKQLRVEKRTGIYDAFFIQMSRLGEDMFLPYAEKIDVYSIGVTMLNILNGQGRENLIFQLKNSLDPKLQEKAFKLKSVIERCVTCNMYERSTFKELIRNLKKFNKDILISHPIENTSSSTELNEENISMKKCVGMNEEELKRIALRNKIQLIGYSDKNEMCEELRSYLPKTYKKQMSEELMGWPFHNKKIKVISTPTPTHELLSVEESVKKNAKTSRMSKLKREFKRVLNLKSKRNK